MKPSIAVTPEKPSVAVSGIIFTIDEFWDSGLFWDNGGYWDEGVSVGLPTIGITKRSVPIGVSGNERLRPTIETGRKNPTITIT